MFVKVSRPFFVFIHSRNLHSWAIWCIGLRLIAFWILVLFFFEQFFFRICLFFRSRNRGYSRVSLCCFFNLGCCSSAMHMGLFWQILNLLSNNLRVALSSILRYSLSVMLYMFFFSVVEYFIFLVLIFFLVSSSEAHCVKTRIFKNILALNTCSWRRRILEYSERAPHVTCSGIFWWNTSEYPLFRIILGFS